jgi:chromosome segregation ATPase
VAKKAVVDELSKTMEALRELEDFDEKIRLCRAKAYWDDHRVARTFAEDVQEKVNEKQGDLNAAQQETDAAESRATNNNGELAVLSEQVGVLTQEVDEMKIQKTAKSKALADVSRQVNTYRASLSTAENARKIASTELKRLTKEVCPPLLTQELLLTCRSA